MIANDKEKMGEYLQACQDVGIKVNNTTSKFIQRSLRKYRATESDAYLALYEAFTTLQYVTWSGVCTALASHTVDEPSHKEIKQKNLSELKKNLTNKN